MTRQTARIHPAQPPRQRSPLPFRFTDWAAI